jgi:hypothetical protein
LLVLTKFFSLSALYNICQVGNRPIGEKSPTRASGVDVMIFKIFLPKNSEKIGVFDSKQSSIMQNFNQNIF